MKTSEMKHGRPSQVPGGNSKPNFQVSRHSAPWPLPNAQTPGRGPGPPEAHSHQAALKQTSLQATSKEEDLLSSAHMAV